MTDRIRIDDREFVVAELSQECQDLVTYLKQVDSVIGERSNVLAVLNRARVSYIESLRGAMLRDKGGITFLE